MSILGGLFLAFFFAQVDPDEYLRHIPTVLAWPSILIGLFKCLCFAGVLATICTYRGYTATGGAKGVGQAVINTAVSTMIFIVVVDWLISFLADIAVKMAMGS